MKSNSCKFSSHVAFNSKCIKKFPAPKNSNQKQNEKIKSIKLVDVSIDENYTKIKEFSDNVEVEYLDTPMKSNNDKKNYRVIKLKNGLTALLIADTPDFCCAEKSLDSNKNQQNQVGENFNTSQRREQVAACALCIGVGSFNDPPEIPGMANFLEHMVFMGFEKYSTENEFDAFLSEHGGSKNSLTDPELTTFVFEIDKKHLLAALDCFTQFFIAPRMFQDAISRERGLVDSKIQIGLPSDTNRRKQLLCSSANPNYPPFKLNWGNMVTLPDDVTGEKLYEKLHKFREQHYSAHRMTLTIQAPLSLETLEEYVKNCFSEIPCNNLPPEDFSIDKDSNPFDTINFRRIYKVKSIENICQVDLTWSMPSLHHLYQTKPHQYVSWIIGHEGKGSIISFLRKKMWCLNIVSGNGESGFEHSSMYALFSLSLVLTDEGHAHLKEVIDAIFSYINMMRKQGPQKEIFDEIRTVEDINFKFTDEKPSVENVESLSENMQYYKPVHYITGSELYFEYDPVSIQACMDVLTPENVNIIISDKKFDDSQFDKVEPWLKTKYKDEEIPADWIESWKNVEPMPEFHLPEPNIFVTDDFTLFSVEPTEVPVKIHKDELCEIWYKFDAKFRLPECSMNFKLISSEISSSPKGSAMCDLLIRILELLFAEELYPATVVGLSYMLKASDSSLIIELYGFNQKLPFLLETIIKCLSNISDVVTENVFQIMKEQQLKEYFNAFSKPSTLGEDMRSTIIKYGHWPYTMKYLACGTISLEDFKHFSEIFKKDIYIKSLIQGNMTIHEAKENLLKVINILKYQKLTPSLYPWFRGMILPFGSNYCIFDIVNETDPNSIVINYYQSQLASIKLAITIDLLMIIMREPLVNELSTQEQLKCNVSCYSTDIIGVFGFSITVCAQTDKITGEKIDDRIEKFLKSFHKILESMSKKDFENHKESLIKIKKFGDIHLREEVTRNWAEIKSGEYIFDRLVQESDEIRKISLQELRNWFKDHIVGGKNFHKLSIQIVGTKKQYQDKNINDNEIIEPVEVQESTIKQSSTSSTSQYPQKNNKIIINDVEDFKNTLGLFPVRYHV